MGRSYGETEADAGVPSIHRAVESGDLESVAEILDRHPEQVHARNSDRDQPLHLACWQKHLELARLLLDRHADVNARGEFGKTPLHYAVYEGGSGSTPLVELLLAAGADVHARDDLLLQAPLGWAVREQHEDLDPSIRFLREHGGELDLEAAALLNDMERVQELLARDDPGFPMPRIREIHEVASLAERLDRETAPALGTSRDELRKRARITRLIGEWLESHDRP